MLHQGRRPDEAFFFLLIWFEEIHFKWDMIRCIDSSGLSAALILLKPLRFYFHGAVISVVAASAEWPSKDKFQAVSIVFRIE